MEALERVEAKLDRVAEDIHEINATLRVQAEQLTEHMRRTALLEDGQLVFAKELKPLTRAHFMWSGVGKGLAVIGTLVGAMEGVLALAKHVGH